MAKNVENAKNLTHELIDRLPEETRWEDLAYRFPVRASFARELADAEAGRDMTTK